MKPDAFSTWPEEQARTLLGAGPETFRDPGFMDACLGLETGMVRPRMLGQNPRGLIR